MISEAASAAPEVELGLQCRRRSTLPFIVVMVSRYFVSSVTLQDFDHIVPFLLQCDERMIPNPMDRALHYYRNGYGGFVVSSYPTPRHSQDG